MTDNIVRTTEVSTLTLTPNGILEHTYEEGVTIDEAEARRVIELVEEMIDGGRLLLLNDMRGKVAFNRESRAFFRENTPPNSAVAFVINSKIGEVTVNFFLKFNSPSYALRIFHEREEAIAWLLEQREEA